ncbi:MAG TPA: hypothetical protein VNZ03_01035 [Terriglobales bacterium]|jgi:hypothetical protein|nr:hypothetical protein [Terriglobales bacterium]
MAQPIVLRPGQHSINGTQQVARVTWHEAVKGTAVLKDGTGTVILSLPYTGQGLEPSQSFNPPLVATGGLYASAPGGWLQIHCQGTSGAGY